MMEKYPNFGDYLITCPTYQDIRNKIEINPNAISIVSKLSLNLPLVKREKMQLPEFPKGWEDMFTECEHEITRSLEFVNQ